MNDNKSKNILLEPVKRFHRKMLLQRCAERVVLVLLAISVTVLAWLWIDKFTFTGLKWEGAAGWLYTAGLLVALLSAFFRRPGLLRAAEILDHAAGTRERLSSALQLQMAYQSAPDENWHEAERAVWKDAAKRADSLRSAGLFRWQPPRRWKALALVLVALGLSAFAPQMDLLGRKEAEEKKLQNSTFIRKEMVKVERVLENIEKQNDGQDLKAVGKITRNIEATIKEMRKRPPTMRDALKKLSKLEHQVQAEKEKMEPAQRAMKRLEQNKNTKKLAKSLKKGDMEAAKKELAELKKKIEKGEIPAAEMNKLKRDLAAAMKEMKNSAGGKHGKQQSESGQENLKENAGEKNLGEQMDSLAESMEKMAEQSMSAEQMDQVMKQLSQCKGNMGSPGKKPGSKGMKLTKVGEKGACKACSGKGCSQCGGTGKQSSVPEVGKDGSTNLDQPGGPGRSWSDKALPAVEYVRLYDPRRTKVNPKDMRSRTGLGQGSIIGSMEVESVPSREEVTTPFTETFESFSTAAEDALDQEQVPLRYRPIVRKYFDAVDGVAEEE